MMQRFVDNFPLRALWIVPVCVVVAVLVGAFLSARQTPLYRASATMVVVPDVTSSDDMIDGLETLERRTVVATLARIPPALETRTQAARQIGLPADESERYSVQAMVLPNTNAIRVEVTGPEAGKVAAFANAVAAATDATSRELYRLFKLEVLAAATAPRGPFHPDPARDYVVSGILGLFAGLLATAAVGFLHQRAHLAAKE